MTARRGGQQSRSAGVPGDVGPGIEADGTASAGFPEHGPARDSSGLQPTPRPLQQQGSHSRDPAATERSERLTTTHATTSIEPAGSDGHERAGVDARRRGWFWHWNSVVTQYAPLIGLKGVGLLNSYTVWTDRREESPHRGYAFPSQQSEADFYGEERSELITINKILVALDLIEIRKEMVLRVDERGRKWRVPHNLYRVKDRPDGADLRAADVLRVTMLAKDDATVYRYVRRVFSPRFKPIDRDNVWHAILTELSDNPLWMEMQLRTAQQESRASARSRAGHRTRAAREDDNVDHITGGQLGDGLLVQSEHDGQNGSVTEINVHDSNDGSGLSRAVDVELCNEGLPVDVGESNGGLRAGPATSAAGSNRGPVSSVARSNSTYDQLPTTTTTTTSRAERGATGHSGNEPGEHATNAASSQPTDAKDIRRAAGDDGGDESLVPSNGRGERSDTGLVEMGAHSARSSKGVADAKEHALASEQTQATWGPSDGLAVGWLPGGADLRAVELDGGGARAPGSDSRRQHADESDAAQCLDEADRGSESRSSDEDGDVARGGGESGATNPGLAREAHPPGQRPTGRGAGARDGVGGLVDGHGGGPLGDPSALVVSLFEAANDRRSSALERILLAELERDADPAARAAGSSGSAWVAEALREAVASGSAFVAPKRIREIVTRWSREAAGPEASGAAGSRSGGHIPARRAGEQDEPQPATRATAQAAPGSVGTGGAAAGRVAVRMPGGADGAAVWSQVLAELARLLDPGAFERLLAGSSISRFRQGTVEVRVSTASAADKLSAEYRPLVERHLNARLPRAVAVSFVHEPAAIEEAVLEEQAVVDHGNLTIVVSRTDYDLASRVWQAIRDDLSAVVSARDLDGIGTVVPLGEDAEGVMLLGTTSSRALRLVDGRCRAEIERALSALLGRAVTVRAVPANGWSVAPPE